MERQKKQNGITLIALVISIIVMLILAGVSLNMTIGDNGIITQAQKAAIMNSIAILQDFLQMEYTRYNEELEEYETPMELIRAKHPEYFFQNTEGYILDSENHVMYLINKNGLPDDIKNQIVGGEATSIGDYYNQRDVYGTTSDLLVYYCENGIDTILGLTKDDLKKDNPLEEAYGSDSKLAQLLNGGTKALSNQDLKKITTLTINNIDDVEIIKEFKNLPNLNTVYFKDIPEIDNLTGIGGAINLTEVRFENCYVKDYSDLVRNKNLNKLYLILPAGGNSDVENLFSKTVGIGKDDLPSLQYLGIVGYPSTLQSLERTSKLETYGYSDSISFNITSISDLKNLTTVTKQAINYLYFNNLNLSSFEDAFEGFSNVYVLRCEYNKLSNLKGIENLSNLMYLFANNQSTSYFGTSEVSTGYNSDVDALASLATMNSLTYIDLTSNSKFKWSKYLKDLDNLEYISLNGCSGILDFSEIASLINRLGKNAIYPGKFGADLIADNSTILNLENTTITKTNFKKLKGNPVNTSLFALNLRKAKIVNDDGSDMSAEDYNELINEVLSTCTNMNYLEISYQTTLNDIKFVKNMPNLYELNLIGDTALTNLSALEEMATNNTLSLDTLMLSNVDIELTSIQKTISKLGRDLWNENFAITQMVDGVRHSSYWYGEAITNTDSIFGLILANNDLAVKLADCTQITNLVWAPGWRGYVGYKYTGDLNLSNCTNLKNLYYYNHSHNLILPENLETLYYGFTAVTTVDFSRCKKLKNVRLFCQNVENSYEEMFSTLPENFNSLEFLWLQDQNIVQNEKIYCDNLDWFSHFATCTNFKKLVIQQNNTWETYQWRSLEGLRYATSLEHLEMNFTINNKESSTYLPDLSGLTKLKFFQLKYGNMNIENLKTCTALNELVINNTNITNVDFLSNIYGLQNVDLSNNQIGNIDGLKGKTAINTLKLGYNNLTDISALNGLNNISYLEINNNKLGNFAYDSEGKNYYTLTVFTDLNQRGRLRNLFLQGNLFDDYSIITNNNLPWDELVLAE